VSFGRDVDDVSLLDGAVALGKSCPVLAGGSGVLVSETFPVK
jgi:hypothetical protein